MQAGAKILYLVGKNADTDSKYVEILPAFSEDCTKDQYKGDPAKAHYK
jgi:hypothetical protein